MRFYSFLICLCLLELSLYAENLDSLLNQYKSASELSKKTKDENAGNLIVYTRDDLERMQVESLQDILKGQRFFRYIENRLGEPDLLNADPISYNSKSIKIYLNDTELTNPIAGTGLILFGNIAMDFIDHVEIYQGFPSFEFAIEPALVVIKLYTKSPKIDAGNRVKALIGTNGSNKENVYTADITDTNIGYFLYANHEDDIRDKPKLKDKTLKRDTHTNHFYASFKKQQTKLEFNILRIRRDQFLGALPYDVPKSAHKDQNYINATLSTKFLSDKSLSFHADYLQTNGNYSATYSPALPAMFASLSSYVQPYDASALTLLTKKEYKAGKNTLALGIQFRHKSFHFDEIERNGVLDTAPQGYTREDIYSLFLEDTYAITQNDLISFSIMGQYYARANGIKDESPQQLRLSYIKSLKNFTSKTFISKQELVPEPYMTAEVHIGNPDLDPENYTSASQEFSYSTNKTFSRITLAYTNMGNLLLQSESGRIFNSDKDTHVYVASYELHYRFRQNDEFKLQADMLKLQGSDIDIDNTHYNYVLRMTNKVRKFDIFNELIINQGYGHNDIGTDYSLGVKYAFTSDLHIAFKGNNVFNTGLKRDYIYTLIPTTKRVSVPVVEQKFMLSMEYLF